jgi:Adenylate and Guanylate cyclase catalytic domain
VGCRSHGLDPPSRRDPCRRRGGLLASDGRGRGRHARAPAGASRELVAPKISEHHRRIVKTTGDGMLAEFPSVVDAVRCAAELQRAMIDREAGMPEDRRIKCRIGINLGNIIVEGDDLFGDGVNVAARLEALSDPRGICISRTMRDQIRDKLAYPFGDLGEQSVKNIARPVRVYALRPEAVADLPVSDAPPPKPAPSTSLRRACPSWSYHSPILVATPSSNISPMVLRRT